MFNLQLLNRLPQLYPFSESYIAFLIKYAHKYGIEDINEVTHWLGQIAVESARFTSTVENLNYSVEGLRIFGNRISTAQRLAFGRIDNKNTLNFPGRPLQAANQRAIANIVYGGEWGKKNLGNTQPNDGWYFRGHGLKQTTGRTNHKLVSQKLYGDDRVMLNPDMLSAPDPAAASAAVYWDARRSLGIDVAARQNDYREVRRLVNGGYNGLDGKNGAIAATKAIANLFSE